MCSLRRIVRSKWTTDFSKNLCLCLGNKPRFLRPCARLIPTLIDNESIIGNRYFHCIDQTRLAKVTLQTTGDSSSTLSAIDFENIAEETLNSLTSYFDELLEQSKLEDSDVIYGDGVLTIKFGPLGTYVINKQTPNKQIWLSSPTSGPKRYDFINQTWIYKHDNTSLYHLLNAEIPNLVKVSSVDFLNCSYGKSVV